VRGADMDAELTSRNKAGADLATSLLADHLGLNLDDLKREREAKIAAEEEEKRRLQREREEAEEARKLENRRKNFAEFLNLRLIRAWVSPYKGTLVEIHSLKDLACPKCGEVPRRLDQLIVAYGDALYRVGTPQRADYDGRIMGYSDSAIKFVPAFRKTIACSCGEKFVVAASYLPVADE